MMFRTTVLAALAAMGASAFAAPVSFTDANLLRLNLGGATALRATFAGLVTNDLCGGAANTDTRFYNTNGTTTFNGNFWAITCPLPAAGAAKLGVATGTPFAFFKTDAGGSAQGVFPLAAGADPVRPFMSTANCTGTAPNFTCTGTTDAPMHFGVSDVEPAMFRELNVPDDSLDPDVPSYPTTGPNTQGMTIVPVVQTVFGVAVNTRLYNDMFAKQAIGSLKDSTGAACTTASTEENCIPSIGRAEARSLFAGGEANWRLLSANAGLVNSQINICRRVQGSGTQAAANAHLMEAPCNGSSLTPARWFASSGAAAQESSSFLNTMADGTSFANYLTAMIPTITAPNSDGGLFVFEGPGTGNVTACLTQAQTAGGYAIGHVSKENAATANWKHVRLEKAVALRDNAKAGQYDYVFESTMQYRPSALTGAVATVVPKFITEAAKPDALARLSTAAQDGVAALPTAYAGNFGTGSANEIKFGSRVTRAGNSCQPLSAVK